MNFKEINTLKLNLYENEKIIITNYKSINHLSDEKIIIDNYVILGDDLQVKELDGYSIYIKGIIKEILINEIYR